MTSPLTTNRRMCTVDAVTVNPPSVTIHVGADSTVSHLATYLSSYWPVVGDTVVALEVGGDYFVLGRPEWSTTGSGRVVFAESTTVNAFATTTEFKDIYVGDLQFNVTPGHLYRVKYLARAQTDTSGTTIDIRIRDGGASGPTNVSPIVTGWSEYLPIPGGAGGTNIAPEQVLDALTPGLHTFAAFYVKTAGPGQVTLQQATGQTRQLIVEDITE